MRIAIPPAKPKPNRGENRVVRKFALLPILLSVGLTGRKEIRWLEWCPIVQLYDAVWCDWFFCEIDFDHRKESAYICPSFHQLCNLADKHNIPFQDVLKYNGLPRYDAKFTAFTVIRIPKEE